MSIGSPRILTWEGGAFPEGIDWRRFECCIVESAQETKLVVSPEAGTVSAEVYDSGFLFGPDVELRWRRRRSGRIHFVAVEAHDNGPWPPASESAPLRPVDAAAEGLPERVLLWGEPRGKEWYESRIPRVLSSYPRELEGKRLVVELAHYLLSVETPNPLGGTGRRDVVVSCCRRLAAAVRVNEVPQ